MTFRDPTTTYNTVALVAKANERENRREKPHSSFGTRRDKRSGPTHALEHMTAPHHTNDDRDAVQPDEHGRHTRSQTVCELQHTVAHVPAGKPPPITGNLPLRR